MNKDIGKSPGNQEQIGLDEKKIPENHSGRERTEGQETSVFTKAPEHDLGLNPPSSQIPSCQTLQEQKLRSRTLSPFAVTPSRLLAGPTEPAERKEEDLMRPTSSSNTSRENENREGAEQPLSKTVFSPRVRQETSSLDSTHRVPQMLPSQAKARAIFHRQVLTFVTKVCTVAAVRQSDTVRHS